MVDPSMDLAGRHPLRKGQNFVAYKPERLYPWHRSS